MSKLTMKHNDPTEEALLLLDFLNALKDDVIENDIKVGITHAVYKY